MIRLPYRIFAFCVALCVASSFVALASCSRPLEAKGTVSVWPGSASEALRAVAASTTGLDAEFLPVKGSWKDGDSLVSDLVYTEWAWDYFSAARTGMVLDLAPWSARLESRPLVGTSGLASFGLLTSPESNPKASYFLPAEAVPWGFFYSRDALARAGLEPPATWNELVESLPRLKAAGVVPFALGSTFGWPSLALVSMIDVRLNGGSAYRDLLEGRRKFDDESAVATCVLLARWRDAGYFGAQPASRSWLDAASDVTQGRAAYLVAGAGIKDRFGPAPTGFLQARNASVSAGQLASVWGFVVAASSSNPETALALADAYIVEGARKPDGSSYRRPLGNLGARVKEQEGGTVADTFQNLEDGLLASAGGYLPTLDKALSPQAAYDAGRIISAFFAAGSVMSGEELARALSSARGGKTQ